VLDRKGLTLVEVLAVVLLLAIAIVPMVSAFSPAIFSTESDEKLAVFTNQARWTLYRILALDFPTLDDNRGDPVDLAILFGSPSDPKPTEAAKETFSFKGQTYSPTVAITDASGGAGGLLQLTVRVEDVSLTTLKAYY
jgi:prepilin-type N-terminal cleavage/methylation domain-containing protein